MTWRLVICFSLLAGVAAAAPVTGRVELRDSADPAVRKGMDYSGVAVWLEPVMAPGEPPKNGLRAKMEQRNKTFLPHVLAIQTGTLVDFPNFDPIFHNAFSNYNGRTFDIGLYAPGTSKSVLFGRSGIVRVFCNIHPTMSAVIVVVDTPYFAVTQKDGTFRIANVGPGEYRLHVFHERATEIALKPLDRTLKMGNDPVMLPVMQISESGYLAVPHTNKYGHEYHAPPDEGGAYPAVRK
jgi:plastocyanin